MRAAADRFRPAGLASLLLHGGAVLGLVVGLHRPPAQPAEPQVIEMAFLPAPEAAPEPTAEPPPDATAEPTSEAASEPPPAAIEVAEAAEAPVPEAPIPEPAPPTAIEAAETPDAPVPEAPHPEPAPEEARLPDPPPPEPPRPVTPPRPRAPRPPRVAAPGPATPQAAPVSAPGPARPAPAPTPAPSAAPAGAVPQSYIAALFAALDRRKEYPESARWRRAEGIAVLHVSLRRDGSVQSWRIERSTGHEDLDAALGSMIRRASPLPAPPADLAGDPIELSVPVRFSLR